jgi:uncharacterized protein involved in copper resistance
VLVALMALHGTAAVAQPAVPCTAIENDAERLACYDRALRGSASPPGAQAPAASAERAATPPRTETQPPAPTAVAPRRERQARESAAPTAPAAPAAGRTSSEEEIIPIVVVGVRALANRETTFTTDDGATWVQTDSQRLTGLPDAPFDAQIKRGAMGSYFLVATEHGRAIRVRPVR